MKYRLVKEHRPARKRRRSAAVAQDEKPLDVQHGLRSNPAAILHLQRTIGNQAVQRLISPTALHKHPAGVVQRAVDAGLAPGTMVKVKVGPYWYAQPIMKVTDNETYTFINPMTNKDLDLKYDSDRLAKNNEKAGGGNLKVYMSNWAVQKAAWATQMESTGFGSCVGLALKAKTEAGETVGMLAHFQSHDDASGMMKAMMANLEENFAGGKKLEWSGTIFRGNLDKTPGQDINKKLVNSNSRVDLIQNLLKEHIPGAKVVIRKDLGHYTVKMSLANDTLPELSEPETSHEAKMAVKMLSEGHF